MSLNLSKHQLNDPIWLKLRAHMEAELERYRISNDSPDNDIEATARLRGRIAQLKDLLGAGKPAPTVSDDG